MSFLDNLLDALKSAAKSSRKPDLHQQFIGYGEEKEDGSHDHRYNKGDDRTPAQKSGDRQRSNR